MSEAEAPDPSYYEAKQDEGKIDATLVPWEWYRFMGTHESLWKSLRAHQRGKGEAEASHLLTYVSRLRTPMGGVVRVLEHGAAKYEAHGWRNVPDGVVRYRRALWRHELASIVEGRFSALDRCSGLPHGDHRDCNAIFLWALLRGAS